LPFPVMEVFSAQFWDEIVSYDISGFLPQGHATVGNEPSELWDYFEWDNSLGSFVASDNFKNLHPNKAADVDSRLKLRAATNIANLSKVVTLARAMVNDKKQKLLELREDITETQRAASCLLRTEDGLTVAFPIEDDPFLHINKVCPELASDSTKSKVVDTIIGKMEARRNELASKGLQYLTTPELRSTGSWISALRRENQIYLIPAYHMRDGVETFCLVASVPRELLYCYSAEGDIVDSSDSTLLQCGSVSVTEKENLEKLLGPSGRSNTKDDFINAILVMYPRRTEYTITTPPNLCLRNGIFRPDLDAFVKVGAGNQFKLALLEVVKVSKRTPLVTCMPYLEHLYCSICLSGELSPEYLGGIHAIVAALGLDIPTTIADLHETAKETARLALKLEDVDWLDVTVTPDLTVTVDAALVLFWARAAEKNEISGMCSTRLLMQNILGPERHVDILTEWKAGKKLRK